MRLECQGCQKRLILKDGSLDKKRMIECPHCGFRNVVEKRKNGKVIVKSD
jgi:DNA-directed RNA polymerase subunit RPC12/RpoP